MEYFCILFYFAIFFVVHAVPAFNDTTGKWEYEAGDKRNNGSSLSDQTGFFQGDIVGIPLKGPRTRNGVLPAAKKWPNAIVPCNSPVGRSGGAQRVSLQRGLVMDYCLMTASIAHELLHAVGLWHEQSRIDRDDYVTINLDNVSPGFRHNYDKVNPLDTSTYNTQYDYRSLMHYHRYGGSVDNMQTVIVTKDPFYQDIIGRAEGPSQIDAQKVNIMYNCQGVVTGTGTTGTGIGIGTGTTKGTLTGTGTGGSNCQDAVAACVNYANQCQWQSVQQLCKKTCRLC